MFLFSTLSIASGLNIGTPVASDPTPLEAFDSNDWQNGLEQGNNTATGASYSEATNAVDGLVDNDNNYNVKYDPWLTKAAIHAIASSDDGDMMALGGGYLYDNEIHLYRFNHVEDQYDLVSEIGSGVLQSDVLAIAFADTDHNNLTEIIAGGEDGRIYVFEQRHIYDPITNMENLYDLVWTSPRFERIFALEVYDTDGDARKDIIVGTGDTVRWYEYDTHGNYPFSEEHWINFKEVFSYKVPSPVTSMAITDINANGLPEVAVGMRSGEIQLLENNGTTLEINGYPYPIMQDNSYRFAWSSGTVIHRAVTDMDGGNLDNDPQNELLIAVQGQGAYVLDNINGVIGAYRVQRPFESWESDLDEFYSLDNYADNMTDSSSLVNGTDAPNPNVYYFNGSSYSEPLNYSYGNFPIYPYRSYSTRIKGANVDGRYTRFNALSRPAWATYDFGKDEEGAGNGITSAYDLIVYVGSIAVPASDLRVSLSADGINFFEVPTSDIVASGSTEYHIEVDPTLVTGGIDYYRYMTFNVTYGYLLVDAFEALSINNPIYDAQSVAIGSLQLKGDAAISPVAFIGTITGALLGVAWNSTSSSYQIVFDSWLDERWKLGTNIFDLAVVKKTGTFPAWMYRGNEAWTGDFTGTLPDGGYMVSYTAENFYDYQHEDNLEFIISSSLGGLFVYTQASKYVAPTYNAELTNMLLTITTLDDYLTIKKSQGTKYFTASLVPIEGVYLTGYGKTNAQEIDPVRNGYWLFLGAWDGSVPEQGTSTFNLITGANDVSMWFLEQPDTPIMCTERGFSLDPCAYFEPYTNASFGVKTLTNMEMTGVMPGVFKQSTWMPKVTSADVLGDSLSDIVLTNGNVHLLEAVASSDPDLNSAPTYSEELQIISDEATSSPSMMMRSAFTRTYTDFAYAYRSNYFTTINNDSKGRVWTNAQLVNFDKDDDFDLILGFARYDDLNFGFNKTTYGMTYWQNEGTAEEPIWVEMKSAVKNNDADSNLGYNRFSDPVLVWNDYDFGDQLFDSVYGFHPLYKTDRPSNLFMFQRATLTSNIFKGKLVPFFASYDHPTSLLAATYPEAKRIDINLKYDNSAPHVEINYGFHILETWSNEKELQDWTISMASADLDNDGKNELIVGDFNNNAYVFEHQTNNTYKRAYKSFDLNRTILTDQSPYANEQFGGISGTFYRTIYEHAQFVLAGMDLNNNTLKEFIVATDSMIFVFEATLTPAGYMHDDTYRLIATIDLYEEPALQSMENLPQITALSWGDDITGDGRRELVVAATNALLIYEISDAPDPSEFSHIDFSKMQTSFSTQEIFFGNAANLLGLYDVPGNYLLNPDYIISALLIEDIDTNGRMDLITAGTNTKEAIPIRSGFISILEWTGSDFRLAYSDEDFANTTAYNPINDLAVTDQDYDGLKELVIGHQHGVDIYEFKSDETVALQEVLTSDPSYMLPDRYYFDSGNLLYNVAPDKDIIRTSLGFLLMVYTRSNNPNSPYYTTLYFEISFDNGETWIDAPNFGYPFDYSPLTASNGRYIEKPSLAQDAEGFIWVTYVERDISPVGSDYAYVRVAKYTDSTWTGSLSIGPYVVEELKESTLSPKVFALPYGASGRIGLAFYSQSSHKLWFCNASTSSYINYGSMPLTGNLSNPENFELQAFDIVQLDITKAPEERYRYGIVFSGFIEAEKLSMDYDLFYTEMNLTKYTSPYILNFTRPNRLFQSGINAFNPSIIVEHATENLLVTFEQPTLRPYGGLFAVWSNDNGIIWHGPYDMSHALGLDMPQLFRAFSTRNKNTYRVGTTIGQLFLTHFEELRPIVAPGITRGFTMTTTVKFSVLPYNSLGFCSSPSYYAAAVTTYSSAKQCNQGVMSSIATAYNPWSNFTWYDIDSVQDLTVGDSDRDSRGEILVASGKQAHLFEMAGNTATSQRHVQKWSSEPYARDLTSVMITDSNGNGFPELVVESDRGVVNTYEVTNGQMGQSNLKIPQFNYVFTDAHSVVNPNRIIEIETVDLTGDSIDDVVFTTTFGDIYAVDGWTHTKLWSDSDPLGRENPLVWFDSLHILQTPTGPRVLFNHYDVVKIYSASGTVLHSMSLPNTDYETTAIAVGDLIPDGYDDFAVGLNNGTTIVYNGNTFAPLWSFTVNDMVRDIFFGSFVDNSTDLVIATVYGQVVVVDGSTGTQIWNRTYDSERHAEEIAVADISGDGLLDIFYPGNVTILLDGTTGDQLWNATYQFDVISAKGTPVYDVNHDNIPDFIIGGVTGSIGSITALNGINGEPLWNYNVSSLPSTYDYGPLSRLSLSTVTISGVEQTVVSAAIISADNIGYVVVLSADDGMPVAVLSGPYGVLSPISTAVTNVGTRTVLIMSESGYLTFYSLWDGRTEYRLPANVAGRPAPFVQLGSDFTRRTTYMLWDMFKDGAISTDGIEDLCVADDEYLACADTDELNTNPAYNTVIWAHSYPDSGALLQAEIADLNNDGTPEIVAAFENYLVIVNAVNGNLITKYDFSVTSLGLLLWKFTSFHFELGDVDNDGVLDIVYGADMYMWSTSYDNVQYGAITMDGTLIGSSIVENFKDPVFALADLDADGTPEIVTYTTARFSPLASNSTVYDFKFNRFSFIPSRLIVGLPPLSNIAVGNFDGNPGDEIMYFFEFSKINLPAFGFLLQQLPTIFLTLTYEPINGTFALPASGIAGISPYMGGTSTYYVTDVNGDGMDDLIGETKTGNLFSFIMDAGNQNLEASGTFNTIAVPYAKTHTIVGGSSTQSGKIVDFGGLGQFASISSGNTLSFYDSLDFSNKVSATASVTVNIDVIQDIVPGDLDNDAFTDILLAGKGGYVWIISTENSFSQQLQLAGSYSAQSAEVAPVNYVAVVSSIFAVLAGSFIAVFYYRRRK